MHSEMLAALQVLSATAQAIGPGDLASLAPTVSALILSLKAFLPMWIASINEFEYYAPTYLAQVAKVL